MYYKAVIDMEHKNRAEALMKRHDPKLYNQQNKTTILLIILLNFTVLLISCKTGESDLTALNSRFTAAIWNLQSMFDGEELGNEYIEFRESSGWTEEKYNARLLSAGKAILKMKALCDAEFNSSAPYKLK